MKTLLQRVGFAVVQVDDEEVGRIGEGVLLFVGVERGDTEADADATARKVLALRLFPGRTPLDRTLAEIGGGALVVSQFTLAASLKKGNRPGFARAESPERAEPLVRRVARALADGGIHVAEGRFGAQMNVGLVNTGPVTLWLDVQEGRLRGA